jgi:hypothetical protein
MFALKDLRAHVTSKLDTNFTNFHEFPYQLYAPS